MSHSKYENDELIFLSEDSHSNTPDIIGVWNVLVVDDDEEIHSVTRLALSDLVVNDKTLHFIHAYSGAEALKIIEDMGSSIAIILLDVVMEADDAGLTVAKIMREEMRIKSLALFYALVSQGMHPKKKSLKITISMTTRPKQSLLVVNWLQPLLPPCVLINRYCRSIKAAWACKKLSFLLQT